MGIQEGKTARFNDLKLQRASQLLEYPLSQLLCISYDDIFVGIIRSSYH